MKRSKRADAVGVGPGRPRGHYSHFARVGDLVFTCGVSPRNGVTGQVVGESVSEQTRQALLNLEMILRGAGTDLSGVVKVTVYLHDLDSDFAEFDETYREVFGALKPARTTVGASLRGFLVEIECIAANPGGPSASFGECASGAR